MKKVLLILGLLLLVVSFCHAGDVSVKGYYRKDGTYVRPYHRSSPDGDKSNNYGSPSYEQRKQYESYPALPPYQYDYDNDGSTNQYDKNDDNDGVSDNYDSNQYGRSQSSQSYSYTPSYHQPSYIGSDDSSTNYLGSEDDSSDESSDRDYSSNNYFDY